MRRLSESLVLGHLLPALQEFNIIREEREVLLQDIGRLLAIYAVGRQEHEGPAGCRRFLRALLSYTKDAVKGTLVRLAVWGFVEHGAVLERAGPCFGTAELDLARDCVAAFLRESNRAVGYRLAECVLASCERFTHGGAVTAAPEGGRSVRALLLELPVQLSLRPWRERIRRWLAAMAGEPAGGELAWWRTATTRCVDALLESQDVPMQHDVSPSPSPSPSECALACFFLQTPDDVQTALASCLRVLERLHSHPYVPPTAQRSALAVLCDLGTLLRQASHAALETALRPCLHEPLDFLIAAAAAAVSSGGDGDEMGSGEQEEEALLDVLRATLELMARLGCVS